nr:linear amide C-N hydrolase [Pirellula sp.]
MLTSKRVFVSILATAALSASLFSFPWNLARACSRAVYFGKGEQIVTGRTMDWKEDMMSNMWIMPRGVQRDGGMGAKGLNWKSKFGSVVVSVYEAGTADGMNERGLVANLLFLVESEYPSGKSDDRPQMSIAAWTQYILDNFASVEDAVSAMREEAFRPISVTAPNGVEGKIHLSISDPSGESAIFEYIKGKLVIHHGKQYQIMTNSPVYDQQLA